MAHASLPLRGTYRRVRLHARPSSHCRECQVPVLFHPRRGWTRAGLDRAHSVPQPTLWPRHWAMGAQGLRNRRPRVSSRLPAARSYRHPVVARLCQSRRSSVLARTDSIRRRTALRAVPVCRSRVPSMGATSDLSKLIHRAEEPSPPPLRNTRAGSLDERPPVSIPRWHSDSPAHPSAATRIMQPHQPIHRRSKLRLKVGPSNRPALRARLPVGLSIHPGAGHNGAEIQKATCVLESGPRRWAFCEPLLGLSVSRHAPGRSLTAPGLGCRLTRPPKARIPLSRTLSSHPHIIQPFISPLSSPNPYAVPRLALILGDSAPAPLLTAFPTRESRS